MSRRGDCGVDVDDSAWFGLRSADDMVDETLDSLVGVMILRLRRIYGTCRCQVSRQWKKPVLPHNFRPNG